MPNWHIQSIGARSLFFIEKSDAGIPIPIRILKILDLTIFPTASPFCPPQTLRVVTIISGRLVPMARTVSPIRRGLTFSFGAN
jgi:hypothetical protein